MLSSRRDLRGARAMDQSNTQVAQSREDLWSIASAQAGAILSKADIAHRVQAIFTTPLASHQLQQALRSGFGGRQSGDERDDLGGGLVGFGDGTGELGHLCDKGPGLSVCTFLGVMRATPT